MNAIIRTLSKNFVLGTDTPALAVSPVAVEANPATAERREAFERARTAYRAYRVAQAAAYREWEACAAFVNSKPPGSRGAAYRREVAAREAGVVEAIRISEERKQALRSAIGDLRRVTGRPSRRIAGASSIPGGEIAFVTAAQVLAALGEDRRIRQHFRLGGRLVELDTILTTAEELPTLDEGRDRAWARVDLGPLVLLQRLTG